jgi:hypothetical protein
MEWLAETARCDSTVDTSHIVPNPISSWKTCGSYHCWTCKICVVLHHIPMVTKKQCDCNDYFSHVQQWEESTGYPKAFPSHHFTAEKAPLELHNGSCQEASKIALLVFSKNLEANTPVITLQIFLWCLKRNTQQLQYSSSRDIISSFTLKININDQHKICKRASIKYVKEP